MLKGGPIPLEAPNEFPVRRLPLSNAHNHTAATMHVSVFRSRRSRYALLCCLAAAVFLTGCGGANTDSADETAETASDTKTASSTTAEWTYSGERGPEAWGSLSPKYATCSAGTAQSPVGIDPAAAQNASLPALSFTYESADIEVTNTGHSFNAAPDTAHTLSIGEDTYRLVQFHQHTPSEHTIDGERYPIELHFVHQNEDGELAVVGVVAETGAKSEAYQPFVEAANKSASSGSSVSASIELPSLLPSTRSYYTYDGSLTTPPCTEGVRWIVLQQPVTLSEGQIDFFAEAQGPSNRPIQSIGERTVQASR